MDGRVAIRSESIEHSARSVSPAFDPNPLRSDPKCRSVPGSDAAPYRRRDTHPRFADLSRKSA